MKINLVSEDFPICFPLCYDESNSTPSFTHQILFQVLNLKNLGKPFIQFVDEHFINFSLIVHEKSLNISDDKKKDFKDNINFFFKLYLLFGRNIVYQLLKISFWERRNFIYFFNKYY